MKTIKDIDVKNKTVLAAVENAYKGTVMVGKFPGYVLDIAMPFDCVDVNVHPAKTEVRFYDDKRVFDAVYYSVLSALNADVSRPQASFNTAKIFQQQPEKGEQIKLTEIDNKANPVPEKKTEKAFIIKVFTISLSCYSTFLLNILIKQNLLKSKILRQMEVTI